jgi:hypothetical protein
MLLYHFAELVSDSNRILDGFEVHSGQSPLAMEHYYAVGDSLYLAGICVLNFRAFQS